MFKITQHFSQVDEAMSLVDDTEIRRALEVIRSVKRGGGTVWLAGNGGSAATASHFANDLSKMAHVKAIALSDMTSTTLAHGNDEGWDRMFSNALLGQMRAGDAVVGISCSGNSENVVSFLGMIEREKMIGLVGPGVSKISEMRPAALIRAMADEITVIEDVHLIICHAMTRSLCDV